MWIKASRNMLIKQEHVEAGSAVEVDDDTGKYLVGIGKATASEKPAPEKKEKKPAE